MKGTSEDVEYEEQENCIQLFEIDKHIDNRNLLKRGKHIN